MAVEVAQSALSLICRSRSSALSSARLLFVENVGRDVNPCSVSLRTLYDLSEKLVVHAAKAPTSPPWCH